MKYYPEFEVRRFVNEVEFKSHVRIKFKKTWYKVLITRRYIVDSGDQLVLIDVSNRFLKECLVYKSCIILSKIFIQESNERMEESIVKDIWQISDKKIIVYSKYFGFNGRQKPWNL